MHYERFRKYGDPLIVKSIPPIPPGTRYSRLTVAEYVGTGIHRNRQYRCVCDCGNEITVNGNSLQSGNTHSCGCYRRDQTRAAVSTHGYTGTRTYSSWQSMRARCSNPRETGYEKYGGKGISVCQRWESFENFLADMGDRPPGTSIDRIDGTGNYEPSNCRWADMSTQNRNRRVVNLTAPLVSEIRAALRAGATPKELAFKYGVSRSTIYTIRRGKSWPEVA